MANICELPLTIVTQNKPKLLALPGLNQKVHGQVNSLTNGITLTTIPIGGQAGPNPSVYYVRGTR
jgi:hypothetical protein